jgi:periplasmic divalent cation tolerance protein
MSHSSAIIVLITAGSQIEAATIAEQLISDRLAACVQILPSIESVYWWKGKIERTPEVLLLAKTTQEKFEDLEKSVRSRHSYDIPEILALPVTAGSAPYLEWLVKNVCE